MVTLSQDKSVFAILDLLRDGVVRVAEKRCENEPHFDTDVVIIGNGPSGLALSAFLSGWTPYYNLAAPHPDRTIHENLAPSAEGQSLFDQELCIVVPQELSWLEEAELSSLAGNSQHRLAVLFDALARPEADLGHRHNSSLCWRHEPLASSSLPQSRPLSHLVISAGPAGGSWHHYPLEIVPLSLSSWLELPAAPLARWLNDESICARLPCAVMRRYFRAYPKLTGTQRQHLKHSTVHAVTRASNEKHWTIEGEHKVYGRFSLRAKSVVLATGCSVPKRLSVPGEENNRRVIHSLVKLDALRSALKSEAEEKSTPSEARTTRQRQPILIVGDGFSAADAVLYCLEHQLPMIHVFRKSRRETKGTTLGRLSGSLYPEYEAVVQLMTGRSSDPLYKAMSQTVVLGFDSDQALLRCQSQQECSEQRIPFEICVVTVGYEASLNYFEEADRVCRREVVAGQQQQQISAIAVDPISYRVDVRLPNVYAVGALAGDRFVRYAVGGCLAVARDIFRLYQQQRTAVH